MGNNLLLGGLNVTIDMDLLRDLDLKEEDIGAGNLALSRDNGWGELVLLDDEESEVVEEGNDETHHLVWDRREQINDEHATQIVC